MSHEGLVNPSHKEALEDVCTRCHAPAGNENANLISVLVASDAFTSQAFVIEERLDDGLLIFPNPTRSRLICTTENKNISEIIVFDSQGRKRDSFTPVYSGVDTIKLELPYPDGIYFLKFISSEGVFSRKIILH